MKNINKFNQEIRQPLNDWQSAKMQKWTNAIRAHI